MIPIVSSRGREYDVFFPAQAKRYLCVPVTSTPSEKVFSGNIVTCNKASLKPKSVDRLVFLAQKPVREHESYTQGKVLLFVEVFRLVEK